MKTKVHHCACGLCPVDCDVTYQLWCHNLSRHHASLWKRRWGRTSVQDIKSASLLCFFKHSDHGRIEIDQLYGLCCRGWCCYLAQQLRPCRSAQLVLCQIVVPTTPALTISWSISITMKDMSKISSTKYTTTTKLQSVNHVYNFQDKLYILQYLHLFSNARTPWMGASSYSSPIKYRYVIDITDFEKMVTGNFFYISFLAIARAGQGTGNFSTRVAT